METKEERKEKIEYIAKTTSKIKLAEYLHTARLNAKWIKKQGYKEGIQKTIKLVKSSHSVEELLEKLNLEVEK